MLKNIILLLVFVSISKFSVGQIADTSSNHKLKLNDISFVFGGFGISGNGGSLEEFRVLAPNSILLNRTFDHFNEQTGISGIIGISAFMGFKFRNNSKFSFKKNAILNLGIGYFRDDGTNEYFNATKYKLDTLITPATARTVYLDSITRSSYIFSYHYQQLRIEGLFYYQIMDSKRFSVFTGIGFSAGLSFNANIEIGYTQDLIVMSRDSASGLLETSPTVQLENNQEQFKNKINYGIIGYIPFKFDLRMSSKNNFLFRNHISYELRTGINAKFIHGFDSKNSLIIYHCIGYRIELK